MESHSLFIKRRSGRLARIAASPAIKATAFIALCVVYFQGALSKILDFNAALAPLDQFSLQPAMFVAVLVIMFELTASAMVISGRLRWAGALALAGFTILTTPIALRFWNVGLGIEHDHANHELFQNLGLLGTFVFVAVYDLAREQGK